MTRSRRDLLLAVAVAAAAGLASFALLQERDAATPEAASGASGASAASAASEQPPTLAPLVVERTPDDGGQPRSTEADGHHSIRALITPPQRVPVSSARAPGLSGHSPGF